MKKEQKPPQKPNTVVLIANGNDWEIKRKYSTLTTKLGKPKDMGGES